MSDDFLAFIEYFGLKNSEHNKEEYEVLIGYGDGYLADVEIFKLGDWDYLQ